MPNQPVLKKTRDAYAAVYKAGDNAYHFVKSVQENGEADVVDATRRDIQRENPELSYVDANLRACIEYKCMEAAATGNGRAKRVREMLKSEKTTTNASENPLLPGLTPA